MDIDLQQFIARHAVDIIVLIIFGAKLFFFSKANLRVKLLASAFLACVFYIGRAVTEQLDTPGSSFALYMSVAIGIRLIALKVIFMLADWED